jgi:hypothetical protein
MGEEVIGWHVYDLEGVLLVDDNGDPKLFLNYDEAKNLKMGGPIAPVKSLPPENAILSTDTGTSLPEEMGRTQSYFQRLRDLAELDVPHHLKEGTKAHTASVAFNMLKGTELDKQSIKAIQAQILIEVVKHDLHLAHPPVPGYPGGFQKVTDFMRAAGVGSGHFYELAAFAEEIAPALEEIGVDYNANLTSDHVAKTLEAVPTMKRMLRKNGDAKKLESILEDLISLPGRRAATEKYRRRRDGERSGDAAVNKLDNHTSVITIVTDDCETIVSALAGKVTWDVLVASITVQGKSVRINTSLP